MSVILKAKDLYVRYGEVEALRGTNLKVESGQIVTVIGPNGVGKSTILDAVMGVPPTTGSASGVVSYPGHSLTGLSVEKRAACGMRLVPEKRELFAIISVEDNLVLGAYRRRRAGERNYLDQMEVVHDSLPRLKERRAQEVGMLFGGKRQMLAVGRALMAKPQLLMLDEPNLGLAPLIVKEIFHIISDLHKTDVATLLIRQNVYAVLQVADYSYVLETGDMMLEGAAQELVVNPRVIGTYLGLVEKAA